MEERRQRAAKTYMQEKTWGRNIQKYWPYYLVILPGLIYFGMLRSIPTFGSIITFKDYNIVGGFFKSPWVGSKNFKTLLTYPDFKKVLTSAAILRFCKTVLIFPILTLLSLVLDEIKQQRLKKGIQTTIYVPYFISWVVVRGLVFGLFGIGGFFNSLGEMIGMKPVLAIQKEFWFQPTFIISPIWKEARWGTVIYLATISGVNPSSYGSASIDGASRSREVKYVTFPLLIPTVVILFLLNIGSSLELGFDQVYNLQTPMTYTISDIFDIYAYRIGTQQAQHNFTAAADLFQSAVGLGLVLVFNKPSQKAPEGGLQ